MRIRLVTAVLLWVAGLSPLWAGALEDYVQAPDASFAWSVTGRTNLSGLEVTRLRLVSQTWRNLVWEHELLVARPAGAAPSRTAFLLIGGDGSGTGSLGLLRRVAEQAGVVAAVLTRVPNQPLFGRHEDALIAHTFDQYLRDGDPTWPLLFPMVKSAVRAMDALQQHERREHAAELDGFIVSGASKRGWTTWLTAAVDARVRGIAPMVIDMLNMETQTRWSEQVYGKPSEKVSDYTDLHLLEKMDTPPMRQLVQWVDPYAYRTRYTMPKLLLLGSNDPYWTVDSLRHYWDALPGPKLLFQTPNAGHDLGGGREATQTLAAFVDQVVHNRPLPTMDWEFARPDPQTVRATARLSVPAAQFRLWTAEMPKRDFRKAAWTSQLLASTNGGREASATLSAPASGYRAFFLEATLDGPGGRPCKLSTEARVTPDTLPEGRPAPKQAAAPPAQPRRIALEEFDRLRQKTPRTLLDVRSPREFSAGHVPGAINLNVLAPDFDEKAGALDRQIPCLVYCARGGRSAMAATRLQALGFREILDFAGGWTIWQTTAAAATPAPSSP